jgi:uncharacterized protein with PIN domain
MILTHLANEQGRCPSCGGYLDETTAHDHVYAIHEQRCDQCNTLDKYKQSHPDPLPGTLLVPEPLTFAEAKAREATTPKNLTLI